VALTKGKVSFTKGKKNDSENPQIVGLRGESILARIRGHKCVEDANGPREKRGQKNPLQHGIEEPRKRKTPFSRGASITDVDGESHF